MVAIVCRLRSLLARAANCRAAAELFRGIAQGLSCRSGFAAVLLAATVSPAGADQPPRAGGGGLREFIELAEPALNPAPQPHRSPTTGAQPAPRPVAPQRPLREELARPRSAPEASIGLDQLGIKPLHRVSTSVEPPPDPNGEFTFPRDFATHLFAQQEPIHYSGSAFETFSLARGLTTAAGFCHEPLYFEEERLERHGHSHGVFQPAFSAVHFFGTTGLLPYKMVVEKPRQCLCYSYPYEAGRHAPRYRQRRPLRLDAGLAEAALILGLISVLP